MIITILVFGILILGIILSLARLRWDTGNFEFTFIIGSLVIGAVTTLTCLIYIINTIFIDSYKKEELLITREDYIQILESEVYSDKLGISDTEIITKIQQFNKTIKLGKKKNESLWINWFISNSYDEVEPIILDNYLKERILNGRAN